MALTKYTESTEIIAGLSDQPNSSDGLTAAQLKTKFDLNAENIKTYLNSTFTTEQDALNTTSTAHSSGDGSDHADVATNSVHVAGDGSDHADVATNTAKVSFPEAPEDSKNYARNNGAWNDISGVGSGDVVGPSGATDGDFAQFDTATGKLIKGGLELVTTVDSPGLDTEVPSAKAVRSAISDAGGGDVSGPGVAVDGNVALFDTTSGKQIKDGGKSLSGADATIITGTAGTTNYVAKWNADGDLVDGVALPTGAIVGISDTQTLTNKRVTPRVSSTASTATLTIDCDSYDQASITAQAAGLTVAAPTGTPTDGQKLIIRIEDNGTTRSISWNAAFEVVGATLPTDTTAGKKHYIGAIWNADDSKWDCLVAQEEV